MAGSWIGIIYGFARMRHEDGKLGFAPLLPAAWESYAFRIHWKDTVLAVSVGADSSSYSLIQGRNLDFEHCGRNYRLERETLVLENGRN